MTMEMIVTDENNGQYIETVSFPALPLDKKEFISKNINGKFFFKGGELQ